MWTVEGKEYSIMFQGLCQEKPCKKIRDILCVGATRVRNCIFNVSWPEKRRNWPTKFPNESGQRWKEDRRAAPERDALRCNELPTVLTTVTLTVVGCTVR